MDSEPVIACSLSSGDHDERIGRWHALMESADVARDGLTVRVEVDGQRAGAVADLARDEQECCPFLAFRLDFHGATITLTITAPSETAEPFLDALMPANAIQ